MKKLNIRPLSRAPFKFTLALLVFIKSFISILLFTSISTAYSKSQDPLTFKISDGDTHNFFYRDEFISAHTILTSQSQPQPQSNSHSLFRLLTAFPAGNAGFVTFFEPDDSEVANIANIGVGNVGNIDNKDHPLVMTMDSIDKLNNSHNPQIVNQNTISIPNSREVGISGILKLNTSVILKTAVLGSIRAIRDYIEGNKKIHSEMNHTISDTSDGGVLLTRVFLNKKDYLKVKFLPVSNARITYDRKNDKISIQVDSKTGGLVKFEVVTNIQQMMGVPPKELFNKEFKALAKEDLALRLSFLVYNEKLLAGAWRYLTYFGRDTLLTLRMLMPVLSSRVVEAGLSSVMNRISAEGSICHEEEIGDWASFLNLRLAKTIDTPGCTYKMVDTNFLLLPILSYYFLEEKEGKNRSKSFFKKAFQGKNYRELLDRHILYLIQKATPFALSPQLKNLLALNPGENAGNWRDSDTGLGYGKYPFDINAALVPSSLRSLVKLIDAGLLPSWVPSRKRIEAMAKTWETHSLEYFRVTIPGDEALKRLEQYAQQVQITLHQHQPQYQPQPQSQTNFYGLSARQNGSVVEVMNTDDAFALVFLENPSESLLSMTAQNVLSRFPAGLSTDVGIVVANSAYSGEPSMRKLFSRSEYHGSVVWSWKQAFMALGLGRQLERCGDSHRVQPQWCQTELQNRLKLAQQHLWALIEKQKQRSSYEVWSWSFDPSQDIFTFTPLEKLNQSTTESNAIQLWSTVYLAVRPRN